MFWDWRLLLSLNNLFLFLLYIHDFVLDLVSIFESYGGKDFVIRRRVSFSICSGVFFLVQFRLDSPAFEGWHAQNGDNGWVCFAFNDVGFHFYSKGVFRGMDE